MTLRRLGAIAWKETLHLRRDRRSLVLAFVLPLVLVLLFGYAISLDVRDIPLAVVDQDRSADSRVLIRAFESSGYFHRVATLTAPEAAEPLLDRGVARLVLVISPGYASDLAGGRAPAVQALLDGGDANTATIALNYADLILARVSAERSRPAGAVGGVQLASRVWYNESLQSAPVIVPGLIAVIMAIIAAMLTSLTIAREWERGTMEQLAATPVGRAEVVLGKLVPYIGIGLIDVAVAVVVGRTIFDVPFRGSPLLFGALSLLFLFGVLGYGIFLSAALKSQILATQIALMSTYLPALLLSGFIFSLANLPVVLQLVSYLQPARFFVPVTRGVLLKGVGLDVLWLQVLGLVLYAAVGLGLAVRAFRKEIA